MEIKEKNIQENIIKNRQFMKAAFQKDSGMSDQMRGIPNPPLEKPAGDSTGLIELGDPNEVKIINENIRDLIKYRRSRRKFSDEKLSVEELSYLLWATQGIEKLLNDNKVSLRTVPSAGARHPFETYLAVLNVEDLKTGIYRYLPVEHKLVFIKEVFDLKKKIKHASFGQNFVGDSAVTFIWSCVPYRGEWRYPLTGHKVMLIDIGHVCQNLYLACESINCGTCAIGAYSQNEFDSILELDGENEFVVYLAPVGKLNRKTIE
ncbi:MAG TPA: SagB/ThcOx family dehydrogenase [Firmicutes bacterium]|nr:SagB/ThcOx family dehydrogenase [Bacillota bacterium]